MAHIEWKINDKSSKELKGFMYGVDYGYHLGNDFHGTKIYKNITDLYDSIRESQKHVIEDDKYPGIKNFPQDGIVEVEIKFVRHIKAEDCWSEYKGVLK